MLATYRLLCVVLASAVVVAGHPAQGKLRVVAVSGTPAERGEQHGAQLQSEIRALVTRWHAHLKRQHGIPGRDFARRFVAATDFSPAIEKWTPGLLDEVRGIAKGSGVDFDSIFTLNLIDEVWAQGGRVRANKCTSIGVDRRPGQPSLVAQNIDVPQFFHGAPTILHIKEASGLQAFVVTLPGLIGANGMNSARLAVAVNTILQLRPRPDGLPVAFVVRGLLQREDWSAARKFLYEVDHASGQNYILGGPDLAHAFECSAQRVVRCESVSRASHTWHTNFPIVRRDWNPEFSKRAATRGVDERKALQPCPRFQELQERFGKRATLDEAAVRAVLSSKAAKIPICNPSTYVCTLMSLDPVPVLRIRVGSADLEFSEHRFPRVVK